MKEAKIRFTHDISEWWNYVVTDKKTKEVIIKGRTKLGLPGKLTATEKVDCMRMSIGGTVNGMGYYF